MKIRRHPNFRLFMAQNPGKSGKYANSRKIFSPSLMSHFIPIVFDSIPLEDLKNIKYADKATAIINLYAKVKHLEKKEDAVAGFTIRDLLQIIFILIIHEKDQGKLPIILALRFLFTQTLGNPENQQLIEKELRNYGTILFGVENPDLVYENNRFLGIQQHASLEFLDSYKSLIPFLDLCYDTKRPGLIFGDQRVGKVAALRYWAAYARPRSVENDLIFAHLSSETTVEDLFGKIYPHPVKRFEYKEGPVLKALKEGKILVLVNLHEPDASVAESLNGVLETGNDRSLTINDELVKVHPDFLAFGIANPNSDRNSFTPALLSRFLSYNLPSCIFEKDLKKLIVTMGLKELCLKSNFNFTLLEKVDNYGNKVYHLGVIFFLFNCIKNFLNFNEKTKLIHMIPPENFNFFVEVAKTGALKCDDNNKLKSPIKMNDLLSRGTELSFTFEDIPSRVIAADILAFCIAAKVVPILQGLAGIGKTNIIKLVEEISLYSGKKCREDISISKNTSVNDLMGQINPQSEKMEIKDGPLLRAMKNGGFILLDEFNLANSEVLSFMAPLFGYPESVVNPVTGEKIKIHKNFRMFATQNPPSYQGREPLPSNILCRCVVIEVPLYKISEIKTILKKKIDLPNDQLDFLLKVFDYTDKSPNPKVTLRHFIKLHNRVSKSEQKKLFLNNSDKIKQEIFIKLNCKVLFPDLITDDLKVSPKIKYDSSIDKWRFRLASSIKQYNEVFIEVALENVHANPNLKEKEIEYLVSGAQKVICQLAFCKFYNEPPLLQGKTSFKSICVRHFSEMIKFPYSHVSNQVNVIYLSALSEMNELLGGIEPHTEKSYSKYAEGVLSYIFPINGQNLGQLIDKNLNNISSENQRLFQRIRKNLKIKGQHFPYCERTMLNAIRMGGIVYLKYLNQPDQAIIEGLNSLLELEPTFTSDGEKVIINPNMFVIGSIPTNDNLSPALQSRFTLIKVDAPELLKSDTELIIINELKNVKNKEHLVEFIFTFLRVYEKVTSREFDKTNIRHIFYWLNYLQIELKGDDKSDQSLKKLAIGAQIIFIDRLSKTNQNDFLKILGQNRQDYLKYFEEMKRINTEDIFEYYSDDEVYLRYLGVKIKSKYALPYIKSKKLPNDYIISETSIKNLLRILCSGYTKQTLNLLGPPGIGKTAVAEIAAKLMGRNFVRICCSESMTIEDLFGTYGPSYDENGKMTFQFAEGILAKSMPPNEPVLILFDEINLAPGDVLSTLIKVFSSTNTIINIKDFSINKKDAIFLCAMNPPSIGGRREDLPSILTNFISSINLTSFEISEIKIIIEKKYSSKINRFSKDNLNIIFHIHTNLVKYLEQQKCLKKRIEFNIRFLQNLSAILDKLEVTEQAKKNSDILRDLEAMACILIYAWNFQTKEERRVATNYILEQYKITQKYWENRIISIKITDSQLIVYQKDVKVFELSQLLVPLNIPK